MRKVPDSGINRAPMLLLAVVGVTLLGISALFVAVAISIAS